MGEEGVNRGGIGRIGLISDTHGLLRPAALAALEGCDLILHAGDVGKPEILDSLRSVAPVVAVRGNVDRMPELPETAVAAVNGGLVYVIHDVKQIDLNPRAAGFRAVVSGHSHRPESFERDGVLYINPGAAGPRRFRLPVTVARLDATGERWTVELVDVG